MSNILQKFYHRMLPLYTPQTEQLLKTAEPSDFSRVAFRYIFTVEAMANISHIIEDSTSNNPNVADFHVSFQTMSRLLPQQAQYRKVSAAAKGLWVYGENDVPAGALDFMSRATLIDTSDTLLTRYWFVISYGPGLGMTLLAEEVPPLAGGSRHYEGFYTFEQDVAYQLISILHKIYPEQVPVPLPPEAFG